MINAGLFIAAIIILFKMIIFACLVKLFEAGVFYLAGPDNWVQFLPEKISEGDKLCYVQ